MRRFHFDTTGYIFIYHMNDQSVGWFKLQENIKSFNIKKQLS